MNRWFKALGVGGLTVLVLAGCVRQRIVAQAVPTRLVLSVSPASPARLFPGALIQVTARAEPQTDLRWVSGTVRIMGAPVGAFKRSLDGSWVFKTMVPPMFSVPSGTYRVKAWGRSMDGREVRGAMTYEVE